MFFNWFKRKIENANGLFSGHYVDIRVFYVQHFDEIPCISFISEIDTSKAYRYIQENYKNEITAIYQHNYFDHEKKEILFNNTLFVLTDKRLIELGNNYCHVLHTNKQWGWEDKVLRDLSALKQAAASSNDKVIGFARSNQVN